MVERKVKKLPLVDAHGMLAGLITAKDISRSERLPFATRDAQGRLRVGAAIGAKGDYLERAAELIRAGVDVIVIDIAHGHSVVMARAIEAFRQALRRRRAGGRQRGHRRGRRVSSPSGASTPSRWASGPAGAARRASPPASACRSSRRWSSAARRSADAACRSSPTAASSATARSRGAAVRRRHRDARQHVRGRRGDPRRRRSRSRSCCPSAAHGARCRSRCCAAWPPSAPSRTGSTSRTLTRPMSTRSAPRGSRSACRPGARVRPILQDMIEHLCSSISYAGASSLAELRALFWEDPGRYLIPLSAAARRESYERPGWGGRGD